MTFGAHKGSVHICPLGFYDLSSLEVFLCLLKIYCVFFLIKGIFYSLLIHIRSCNIVVDTNVIFTGVIMKKLFEILVILTLPLFSGCYLDDLSIRQEADGTGSVSIDNNFGLIGNQVIERRGNGWVRSQKLDATSFSFGGEGVHLHENYAIIGNSRLGEVKIFKYDFHLRSWELSAHISESNLFFFGESVYINKDIAIVGAPRSNTVVLYSRVNGQWSETHRIIEESPSDINLNFGQSVDLEGDYLFVGANSADKVFIYDVSLDEISLVQVLDQLDENLLGRKQFGFSLDAHDNLLAVSAYQDLAEAGETTRQGRVYLYGFTGEQWVLKQSVVPFADDQPEQEIISDSFGHNLALNDGNLMVGDDGEKRIYHYVSDKYQTFYAEKTITSLRGNQSFGYELSISDHYLLTGGAELHGPDTQRVNLKACVVDANGNPVVGQIFSGSLLADIRSNDLGCLDTDLGLGWNGVVSVSDTLVDIPPMLTDVEVETIKLDYVPEYWVFISSRGVLRDYMIHVSGIEEPILTRRGGAFISLPNGWRGEIRPSSDSLSFEPESVFIDGLTSITDVNFQVSLITP